MTDTLSPEPTLELNTRELNLNHLGARLPTVRCLVQWLQAQAALWPLLERLALPAVKMGLRTVDQLQRLAPRLVRLDLTMVLRHCDDMLPFASATLRELCFPCGSKMTDAGLCDTLTGCPQLRVLELPECNYIGTVSVEHAVRVCPKLGRVGVVKCIWVDSAALRFLALRVSTTGAPAAAGAGGAPLHRWASSIGTKKKRLRVSAAAAASTSPDPPCAITWLDATQCRALCDASLQQLFGTLRALCLNGCVALTDVSIHNIVERCPSMQLLDISWSQITDAGLARLLRGCRALQFLGCAHCDHLTDEGIRQVRPVDGTWAEINQVSFRSCPGLGAPASVEICAHWPMLRKMDLGGLPVPPAATLADHGWAETRCQQFYRERAPAAAAPPPVATSAAPAKRSYEDMLEDGWEMDP